MKKMTTLMEMVIVENLIILENHLDVLINKSKTLLEKIDYLENHLNPFHKNDYEFINDYIKERDIIRYETIVNIKNYESHLQVLTGNDSPTAIRIQGNIKNKIDDLINTLKIIDDNIKSTCLKIINDEKSSDIEKLNAKKRIDHINSYDYSL